MESGLVFYIDINAKAGATTMEGENGYWVGTSDVFHKKCERAIHPLTKKLLSTLCLPLFQVLGYCSE